MTNDATAISQSKRNYSALETEHSDHDHFLVFNDESTNYVRPDVTNSEPGLSDFNRGLQLLISYQHEEAAQHFLSCVEKAPNCAFAHALIALCHSPNYNFKGVPYYEASFPRRIKSMNRNKNKINREQSCMTIKKTDNEESKSRDEYFGNKNDEKDDNEPEYSTNFPNQLLSNYHSRLAVEKVNELKKSDHRKKTNRNGKKSPTINSDDFNDSKTRSENEIKEVEVLLINAIRVLNCNPGTNPSQAERVNGYPFAHEMRKVYEQYPNDPEVCYFFVESLMVLNAWKLFDYPSGRPLSAHVNEVKIVLEDSLKKYPHHLGLCHMYVHLCEMSTYPEKALPACDELRTRFPDAGHLIHMPTHIDVLVGDYDACVRWNDAAINADMNTMERSPETSCVSSFYFGYICHNYHMLIYGAILGAMEEKAMSVAKELNTYLQEDVFIDKPELLVYLESYGTMDVHVLVRFGRWKEILTLVLPKNRKMMLYRAASIYYAQAIAHANMGDIQKAKKCASMYEELRALPDGKKRILHNNTVADLLDVDSHMIKGEIAFFEGKYDLSFEELRQAIKLQDNLNYDEPWGKMQPVRHALAGLLLKQNFVDEAIEVYREDLQRLPKNPWSLKGLSNCLRQKLDSSHQSPCCCSTDNQEMSTKSLLKQLSPDQIQKVKDELMTIEKLFVEQRKSEYADYNVTHSCACCIEDAMNDT